VRFIKRAHDKRNRRSPRPAPGHQLLPAELTPYATSRLTS
jgi:hypothetical protein